MMDHSFPGPADRLGFAGRIEADVFRFVKKGVGASESVLGEAAVPDLLGAISAGGVGVFTVVRQAYAAVMTQATITARLYNHLVALLDVPNPQPHRRDHSRRFVTRH